MISNWISFTFAVLACGTYLFLAAAQDCPRRGDGVDWTKKFSKCYSGAYERENFNDCFHHCNGLNAQMLCIENKEENDYIAKILSVGFEDMEVWLGGGPDFTPKVNEITGAAMEIPNGKFRAARGTLAKFCVCQDSFERSVSLYGEGDDDSDDGGSDDGTDLRDLYFVWFIVLPIALVLVILIAPLLIYYLRSRDYKRGKVLREFLGYDHGDNEAIANSEIELPNGVRLGSSYGNFDDEDELRENELNRSKRLGSSSVSSYGMFQSRSFNGSAQIGGSVEA